MLHRLVDIWATGEASASLGFAAARLFDELDPLEKQKDELLAEQKLDRPRRVQGAGARRSRTRWSCSQLAAKPAGERDEQRARGARRPTRWCSSSLLDSLANVLCPACKLWNTGHGANMMREAVSLMGGYGVTEDCPGFLGPEVDGRPARGHLRRPGGRAAPPALASP